MGSISERVGPREVLAVADIDVASGVCSVFVSVLVARSYEAKAVGVVGSSAIAQVTSPGSFGSCARMLVVPAGPKPSNMQPNAKENRMTPLANNA
ncbi:MAG: hypothetical protein ACKO38_10555 [Planctomycetota bacterium]